MFWDRAALKNTAKGAMRMNYGNCVLVSLIVSLIVGLNVSSIQVLEEFETGLSGTVSISRSGIGLLVAIFIGNIMCVGSCRFFIENRDYEAPISKILFGFQNGNYGNVAWTMFLRDIKTELWYLLLVIPGIIKTYEYRMVPYILAEQPDLPQKEVFAISKELMMGQKMEAFILDLSFIGWGLFAVFTCGLGGIFWAIPYRNATNTELYIVLRNNWMQRRQHMENPYEGQGEAF